MNKPNLREIKKEATAHALAESAFELAIERGLDGFVVEDVVQRAGYSRRTFANHFSCKEEAVAMSAITICGTVREEDVLAEMPEHAKPLDVLHHWLKMQLTAELLRRLRELVSLSERHPTMEPYILSVFHRLQKEAEEALDFVVQGRYPEGYSHLLIGAVFGAILPILEGSLQVLLPDERDQDTSEATSFDRYLDFAFGYLRNGF